MARDKQVIATTCCTTQTYSFMRHRPNQMWIKAVQVRITAVFDFHKNKGASTPKSIYPLKHINQNYELWGNKMFFKAELQEFSCFVKCMGLSLPRCMPPCGFLSLFKKNSECQEHNYHYVSSVSTLDPLVSASEGCRVASSYFAFPSAPFFLPNHRALCIRWTHSQNRKPSVNDQWRRAEEKCCVWEHSVSSARALEVLWLPYSLNFVRLSDVNKDISLQDGMHNTHLY